MTRTDRRGASLVWLLIVGAGFVTMARAMSLPFLAIYLHQRMKLDPATIGLVLGTGAMVGTFGGILGGHLSDVLGRRRILVGCLALSGAAFLILHVVTSLPGVFMANVLINLASAFYEPVSKAAISDSLSAEDRYRAFGRRYVANNIGFAIGPVLGAMLGTLEHSPAFLITGAAYGLFALVVFGATHGMPSSSTDTHAPTSSLSLTRRLRVLGSDRRLVLLTLGSMLAISVHGEMSVTFSQYLVGTFADGLKMFAWLMSTNAITVVLAQPLLHRFGERRGPQAALTLGAVLLAIGAVGFAHSPGMTLLVVSMVVFTLGEVLLVPSEYAILDAITPESMRGIYYGAHTLSNLGNLFGPWLGGLALLHLGGIGMFYAMGLAALASLGLFVVGAQMRVYGINAQQIGVASEND